MEKPCGGVGRGVLWAEMPRILVENSRLRGVEIG